MTRRSNRSDSEVVWIVIHAALYGTREASRRYSVAPSTVHYWTHHPEFTGLFNASRVALQNLADALHSKQMSGEAA